MFVSQFPNLRTRLHIDWPSGIKHIILRRLPDVVLPPIPAEPSPHEFDRWPSPSYDSSDDEQEMFDTESESEGDSDVEQLDEAEAEENADNSFDGNDGRDSPEQVFQNFYEDAIGYIDVSNGLYYRERVIIESEFKNGPIITYVVCHGGLDKYGNMIFPHMRRSQDLYRPSRPLPPLDPDNIASDTDSESEEINVVDD